MDGEEAGTCSDRGSWMTRGSGARRTASSRPNPQVEQGVVLARFFPIRFEWVPGGIETRSYVFAKRPTSSGGLLAADSALPLL